ncbi:MAG: DUF1566 domain-containing protein [Myxococcaceae bacterium]|nr:DUF1566 domain-containing protein [Myxococcaceae bacterium]MBH2005971.1 DUF1566 domain-containing protein [Myxococcaceae bacterium]
MTFKEAEAYAGSRRSEGWRLSTIWELEALYQQQGVLGERDNNWYWSGTLIEGSPGTAWVVIFASGNVSSHDMRVRYYVRCVR